MPEFMNDTLRNTTLKGWKPMHCQMFIMHQPETHTVWALWGIQRHRVSPTRSTQSSLEDLKDTIMITDYLLDMIINKRVTETSGLWEFRRAKQLQGPWWLENFLEERVYLGLTLTGNCNCKEVNGRIWCRQWGTFVSEKFAGMYLHEE